MPPPVDPPELASLYMALGQVHLFLIYMRARALCAFFSFSLPPNQQMRWHALDALQMHPQQSSAADTTPHYFFERYKLLSTRFASTYGIDEKRNCEFGSCFCLSIACEDT